MLELDGVDGYYGRLRAIRDVSLAVDSGGVTALVGRNGAGKTTTLRCAMGLTRAEGVVRLAGTDVSDLAPEERAAAGLGWVPTNRHVFPDLTVEENLLMGFGRGAVDRDAIGRVYDAFPALADRAERDAGTLSGGERQMLVVGRALVRDPDVLLLDEPTEGLMPAMVDRIAEIVEDVAERGSGVLLAEQSLDRALRMSDDVVVLSDGEVVERTTASRARDDPEIVRRHTSI